MIYLDSKGLLPKAGEGESDFIARGEMTLSIANNPPERATILRDIANVYSGDTSAITDLNPDSSYKTVGEFKKGVLKFCEQTRSDISWVPVLSFVNKKTENKSETRKIGESSRLKYITSNNIEIDMPYMIVLRGSSEAFDTGLHESFHVIRNPLFSGTCYEGAFLFDHLGALINRPLRRWLINPLDNFIVQTPMRIQLQFLKLYRRLRRRFGPACWYVFVRLSYDEMYDNFLIENLDPVEYLRDMSGRKENLRHRIICRALGI